MDIILHLTWWKFTLFLFTAVIMFFTMRLWVPSLIYIFWRITGGVRRDLKYREKKSLPELYGILDPCFMSVELSRAFGFYYPGYKKTEDRLDIKNLGNFLTLKKAINESPIQFILIAKYIFPVKASRVRYGCCRRYSLKKAHYYKQVLGGDPFCGGGIKDFFPPRIQSWFNLWKLKLYLNSCVEVNKAAYGWLMKSEGGIDAVVWGNPFGEKMPTCYVDVYFGKKNDVKSYAVQNHLITVPLKIQFAD